MNRAADVVCLSHLRWGFVFQRPNHLMSRCARSRRVFFWEEPVYDESRDAAPHVRVVEVEDGLRVLTPHLPRGTTPDEALAVQRRLLRETLASHEVALPVLWLYTPMALDLVEDLPASAVVYDCMDELSAFRGAPPELREHEARLFTRADVVFTGGHSLYESKKTQHPSVHCFPSSVDAAHFARARLGDVEDPPDQAALRRPRIGYFGVIDERIDLALVARVADARPDWEIVMIGPLAKIDPSALPRRDNLHYLGQKSYDDLPAYLAGWDVAMMPFALNEATRFISPTKTLEYLAAGKPVVSTAIHDVVHPYGVRGLVRIGDAETFVDHVAQALAEPPEARRALADEHVAKTSWRRTWQQMSELVDRIVAEPRHAAHAQPSDEGTEARCSTI